MVQPARMKRATRAVRIGESRCGLGVFARRRFITGDSIAEIRGKVIADPEYWSAYCIDLGGGAVLEPAAPFRFINHSCQPNCELVDYTRWDDATGAIRHMTRVRAIAPINSGHELTIDYAWPSTCAIPCLCGSERCRGWIVAEASLRELLESIKTN